MGKGPLLSSSQINMPIYNNRQTIYVHNNTLNGEGLNKGFAQLRQPSLAEQLTSALGMQCEQVLSRHMVELKAQISHIENLLKMNLLMKN